MSHTILQVFGILIAIAIPAAAFVAGLRATEPLWLLKRGGLLGRSLLSILIIVPVVTAILLEWLAPGDFTLRVGLMISILSIGIGPPDLMKSSRARDDSSRFEVGLDVVLLTLAIVYIPLAVALHGVFFEHYGREVPVTPWRVAGVVGAQALLPFLAGLGLVRFLPKIAPFAERYAERFVNLVLLVVVVVALVAVFPALVGVGARGWLVCAAIAMVAIVIGHLLGGPAPETRSVLALFSAVRFPGLALLFTQVLPRGERFVPVVLAYVIASAVLSGVYRAAVARRRQRTLRTA